MLRDYKKTKVNTGCFKKGQVSPFKGKKMSEETKAKIKEKRKLQTFSLETRRRMREAHLGDKSPFWKGGVAVINKTERQIIMSGFEYRLWRTAVFERDNYTCVWCGDKKGGNLEADHIKSFQEYPELRFAIDNGRTLCNSCHRKTSNYGNRNKKV